MLWVTLGALVVAAIAVASLSAVVSRITRQYARERAALLDRIMHLSGKTWSPPPVDNGEAPEPFVSTFHWGDDAPPPGS